MSEQDPVYPDEDSLMRIAERVHAARTNVTHTAEDMLGNADQVRTLHSFPMIISG